MIDFKTRIKNLRVEEKLSQEAFGALFGQSKGVIAQWEAGNNMPRLETLILICDHYDKSLDWLVRGIGDIKPKTSPKTEAKEDVEVEVEVEKEHLTSSALMAAQLRSNEIAMHTMIRAMRLVLSHVQGVSERKAKEQLDKILIEVSLEYPDINTFHGGT